MLCSDLHYLFHHLVSLALKGPIEGYRDRGSVKPRNILCLKTVFFFFFLDYRGFYVCLGRDGKVYDGSKYGWLEGRQVSGEIAELSWHPSAHM